MGLPRVRAALDRMLADATGIPDIHPSASVSGADLAADMQASPYKEIASRATLIGHTRMDTWRYDEV